MQSKQALQLITWFEKHQRDLPWRHTKDPYAIWLSEVMLQQTQVDTVIPYYQRFLAKYPSVQDLARADMDDVLKLWEGLGYYSRAKRLIPCAIQVVEKHQGHFPKEEKALLKLPGIGPYTAGAILSIAYNKQVPAVDGNVLRVVARLDCLDLDIGQAKNRPVFEDIVRQILPKNMRAFNQAMMELGAMVCTPKSPKCDGCPLQGTCLAYKTKTVGDYPVKLKKTKAKTLKVSVALVYHKNRVLIYQKAPDGLIGGLWAFPYHADEIDNLSALKESVWDQFGITLSDGKACGQTKHVFTHQIWHMTLYAFEVSEPIRVDDPKMMWASLLDIDQLPMSTAMKRVLPQVVLGE